jgi:hypothetical protein
MRIFVLISTLLIPFHAPAATPGAKTPCNRFSAAVTQGTSAQKLKRWLDVQWDYLLNEFPEMATL